MKIIFIEKITFFSLLSAICIRRPVGLILYFDPASPCALRMITFLRKTGLIKCAVRRINCHIGQIRNEVGDGEYGNILNRTRLICQRIRKERFEQDSLITSMGSIWAKEKILLFFDRLVEHDVNMECFRMNLIKWVMKNEVKIPDAHPVLLIKRTPWLPYLKGEAQNHGIHIMSYWKGCPHYLFKNMDRVCSTLKNATRYGLRRLNGNNRPRSAHQAYKISGAKEKKTEATLAINYWSRNLRFDITERSEFFWLNGVDIPTGDILLYNYASPKQLDVDTLCELNDRGIRILGRGPGIHSWIPSVRIGYVFARLFYVLLRAVFTSVIARKRIAPGILGNMVHLSIDFSYWYDFYRENRVKVNVGTIYTSVGQILAMDHWGGVTIAYQYAVAHFFYPTKFLSSGQNVVLVFSEAFRELYMTMDAPVEYMVQTGFIYDGAIRELSRLNRVDETRVKLCTNGAKFIICFFDENSVNRWDILCSDDDAVYDYEYLLNWLIADQTLGIIFKPKNSTDLFKRLSPVAKLIDQARKTGRCEFLTSDVAYGNIFPAESALMADICIGKLLGTSAALEARLAGKPTIMIDTEGLKSHPFYQWGKGRVLFENWPSLRQAVEQYRLDPDSESQLGNWDSELAAMDPFQDGQAGLRMGNYIAWIYDALKKDVSRDEAMAEAAAKYTRCWGNGYVTHRNN